MRVRVGRVFMSLVLACAVESSAISAEYACEQSLGAADAVIKSDPVTKQLFLDASAFKTVAGYYAVCFTNTIPGYKLYGQQLHIHNALGAPVFISNLFVQQNKALTGCDGAPACSSVTLTGDFPIILRNPRIEWTGPAATPNKPTTTDGLAIASDNMTIEVTPEKQADPAYVTVANFRTGIVVDNRTGVVLDGVKIARTVAQVGSLGLRVAGPGNTVTNASTVWTATGIHALGGTAAAPIQISGGTFSGKNAAGASCNACAGLFLQGGYVSATGTAEHPLTIADYQQGVVLDPVGPMGIGGKISNAKVGIEIRNAVPSILPLLALQPKEFFKVDKLYDWKGEVAADSASIVMGKGCLTTVKQVIDGVEYDLCDVEESSKLANGVKIIEGILPEDFCTSEENYALLYSFYDEDKSVDVLQQLEGKCDIAPFQFSVAFVPTQSDLKVVMASKGQCGFHCTEALSNGAPLNISLKLGMAEIILVTDQGLLSLPPFQLMALNDSDAAPGVMMATPTGGAPGVSGGGDGPTAAGLAAITGGADAKTGLDSGVLGGGAAVIAGGDGVLVGGGNGDTLAAQLPNSGGNMPGSTPAPGTPGSQGNANADDSEHTIGAANDETASTVLHVFSGGSMGSSGPNEGAPTVAGAGGGAAPGCSLLLGHGRRFARGQNGRKF